MSPSRPLLLSGRRRERAAGEQIAALFEEHGRMVYGVCRLLLRDSVEAEDAAQQTFLSAYRGLLVGQVPREPAAWLGTIARNECRSRLRARGDQPVTLMTAVGSDDVQREVGRREEIDALCWALAQLPAQQRDAIVLREFYGLSYREVAAALGVSGSAVESLLFRSRKRLQHQLRPLREALGVVTLPVALRDGLAQALPGFGAGGASAGAAALAKFGSVPAAAKIAAAVLAIGTAGTVAGIETHAVKHHHARTGPKPTAPGRNLAAPAPAATRVVDVDRTLAPVSSKRHGERSGKGSDDSARERSGPGGGSRRGDDSETGTSTRTSANDRSGPSGKDGGAEQAEASPTPQSGSSVSGDLSGSGHHDGSREESSTSGSSGPDSGTSGGGSDSGRSGPDSGTSGGSGPSGLQPQPPDD